MVREALSWHEFEGLDLSHEYDRLTAMRVHEAIEALGISEQLQAEENDRRMEASRVWLEEQERKAKEAEAASE